MAAPNAAPTSLSVGEVVSAPERSVPQTDPTMAKTAWIDVLVLV